MMHTTTSMIKTQAAIRRKFIAMTAIAWAVPLTMPTYASGIPTVDVAAIAQNLAQHAENIKNYLEQIAVLRNQLEASYKQFDAITGSRGLGNILSNPTIRSALPDDWRGVLESGEASASSISRSIDRIRGEQRFGTPDFIANRQSLMNRTQEFSYRVKALYTQIDDAMGKRYEQIDLLQSQIDLTVDPKAIADLQARLQIEQSNIQADQMRADMVYRQAMAEQQLIVQQARQLAKTSFSIHAIGAPLPGAQ